MGNTHALGTQQKETYRSLGTPPQSPYLQIIRGVGGGGVEKREITDYHDEIIYLFKNGFRNSLYPTAPWSLSQL
jgi:hypothetical protein